MASRKTISVLLAEDHPIVRQGIRRILEETPDIGVAGEAEDGEQALELARDLQPGVILCDIRLPGVNGIEVIRRLKDYSPDTKSIVLSAFDNEEYVFETIASGASGYLLKTMDVGQIPDAVRRVVSGETVLYPPIAGILARLLSGGSSAGKRDLLTLRERDVLDLASRGLRNKEIARNLNMSTRTVEGHFSRIFVKLSVSSRVEAIRAYNGDRLLRGSDSKAE